MTRVALVSVLVSLFPFAIVLGSESPVPSIEVHYREAFAVLRVHLKEDGFADEEISAFDVKTSRFNEGAVETKMLGIVRAPRDYSHFSDRRSVREAAAFVRKHKRTFRRVEKETGVAPTVVAAILWVETAYGLYPAKHGALETLTSLAALTVPSFGERIAVRMKALALERKLEGAEGVDWGKRTREIGDKWYEELKAFFVLAKQLGWQATDIRSSWAGAVGYGQFMPSTALSLLRHNGGMRTMDLWNWADTIELVARYLRMSGWSRKASLAKKRAAVFEYNRLNAYVDAVLKLKYLVDKRLKTSTPAAATIGAGRGNPEATGTPAPAGDRTGPPVAASPAESNPR